MNYRELTGAEYDELSKALVSAYPTPNKLRQAVKIRLDKNLDALTGERPLGERTFELVEIAESEGWTANLIEGMHVYNPGNPALHDFYLRYQASAQRSLSKKGLERLVDASGVEVDIVAWRERLEQIEAQVCRVEINGSAVGTGFLVANDIILTNFHVIEHENVTAMSVHFDHKLLLDGTELKSGNVYKTVAVIDQSRYSQVDLSYPRQGIPDKGELDYAFLRVEAPVGTQIVRGKPREFIRPVSGGVTPGRPLFIVGHPAGKPLKVALDTILAVNDNQTRVLYRTNTERGSSGSPCFDGNWDLVALHHGGDPRFDRCAEFNEGIPIEAIRANLKPGIKAEIGWT